MKKRLKRIFLTTLLLSPTLISVSCSSDEKQIIKAAKIYYNEAYGEVIEFQGKIRLASKKNNKGIFHLIIPKKTSLKYVELFNGVTKIEPILWNFNPSQYELENHLKTYIGSLKNFKKIIINSWKPLEQIIKKFKNNSDGNFKKFINFLSNFIEYKNSKYTYESMIKYLKNEINSMGIITSFYTIGNQNIFNPEIELNWSSKFFKVSQNESLLFQQLGDVFFNLHVQHLLRLKNIESLINKTL